MKLKYIFDESGNFKRGFDPYREDPDHPWMLFLFDDGDLNIGISEQLENILNKGNLHWNCDAAQLYHADWFSGNTKGNYSAIYYWR